MASALVEVQAFDSRHLEKLNATGMCKSCNLIRANLAGVNLSRSNLSGAYLREANLTNANLNEADLTGAIMTGAVFLFNNHA